MRNLIAILPLVLLVMPSWAQKPKRSNEPIPDKTRVLLILDCSRSMWDHWQSDSKIKVTQKVLLNFLDSVASQNNVDVALRVFGHLNKDSYGTRLEVPFGSSNVYQIQSKIKTLVPNGGCTAATALTDALTDFPVTGASRNIILIITDGMDDCDGNICDVARQVQLSGVIVKTFILGIGNPKDFQHNLDCAGRFTYLPNEEQYRNALNDVFRLSDQKAQVVLQVKDPAGSLYETEVPVAFYDHQTHVVKYNTIYTLDNQYRPDTLEVDPLNSYDITFFTQPPLTITNRQFEASRVNPLEVTVEQGGLRLRSEMRRVQWVVPTYQVLVRPHGKPEILSQLPLGEMRNLRAGRYDLEVMTLPALRLDNVEVRGGSNTDLTIPAPGLLNLTKPKVLTSGSIFVMEDGVLQWVCNLNPNSINERILLLPGEYLMMVRPQSNARYKAVKPQRFSIESGQQTYINFEF